MPLWPSCLPGALRPGSRGRSPQSRSEHYERSLMTTGVIRGGPNREPLADMHSDLLATREVPPLAELRLQALELRVDADLHQGRHAEVIAEVQALAAEHPLRERLHGLLILALYRDGRQAEALAAFRAARTVLIEELGVEPGPGLTELHHQILNADPVLRLPSALGVADDVKAARAAPRDRLASRRRALGLTQEDLAARLQIERSTVVRWERGTTQPLPASPASLVLVTSRNQLAGLAADGARLLTLDVLPHGEAVQLLSPAWAPPGSPPNPTRSPRSPGCARACRAGFDRALSMASGIRAAAAAAPRRRRRSLPGGSPTAAGVAALLTSPGC